MSAGEGEPVSLPLAARRPWWNGRALRPYGAAAALSIVAASFLLRLPRLNLRFPFEYRGDAILYSAIIKSVGQHGWFWSNPSLGAPGGLLLYDYPNVAHESFHLLIVKLLSAFIADWPLVLNLYFLLGFPLIAMSALAVFRHFGVGDGPAIAGSVLYAFLPTRLLKGEGHIFLDVYYQVPLAILVILWVCGDAPPALRALWARRGAATAAGETAGGPTRQARGRALIAALVCALSASTSSYYSFFTICLLVVGGAWASLERRSARNAIAGLSLAAIVVAGMAANGLPSMLYHLRHGSNPEVATRAPGEAELYGMKVAQLLLPVDGHRLPALRALKQRYNASAPLVGENSTTSLGLVGSAGFLALLWALVSRRRSGAVSAHAPGSLEATQHALLASLALLNLVALLIATVGGFGSLFALLVSPQIRTYSRFVVFIGFFSLFAVALGLDRIRRARPILGAWLAPVVLVAGLFDQTPPALARPRTADNEAFASDRDLVGRIEARLHPGASVFAMPYVSFPEGLPEYHLQSNDLLRPYLHSSTLRWSLPTMRGRGGDLFARTLTARAPRELVETLGQIGFAGILVNRDGYPDAGAAVEAGLVAATGAQPLVSADGRRTFFALPNQPPRAQAEGSPADLDRLLQPLVVTPGAGFSGLERDGSGTFRWAGHHAEIDIDNGGKPARRLAFRATFVAARPPARLSIGGDLVSARVELDAPVAFARELDVPPGHHTIHFDCDGPAADVPNDPRALVWRLADFTFEERPAP